jgi:hypothetical protein
MLDVRQGPLLISQDPFATLAERATGDATVRDMSEDEFNDFITAAGRWKGPRLIAFKGFDPRPLHSLPVFYLDGATWRDTLTGEAWEATNG